MNSEIENLIKLAKEGGNLTEKQRSIILQKAKTLGEDCEEVEFWLEMACAKSANKNNNAQETHPFHGISNNVSVSKNDQSDSNIIKGKSRHDHSFKKKGKKHIWLWILLCLIVLSIPTVVKNYKVESDVNTLLLNHDFDGAKIRVLEHTSDEERIKINDDILEAEINYLLENGQIDKAKLRIEDISSISLKDKMEKKVTQVDSNF